MYGCLYGTYGTVYVYGHDQYRTVPDSVAAVTNGNCWYYMTASYPN